MRRATAILLRAPAGRSWTMSAVLTLHSRSATRRRARSSTPGVVQTTEASDPARSPSGLRSTFDSGIVNSNNLPRVRKIIEDRLEKGKELNSKKATAPYTVERLKSDIRNMTRQKEAFVFEAGQRESRLMRILMAMKELRRDERFGKLLAAEGLTDMPELKGQYAV